MKTLGYIALFALIQLVSLVLTLIGIPLVGFLSIYRDWEVVGKLIQWRGGALTWIWGNEENGIVGPGMALTRWNAFYWSALRNPCNNLRFVPGVSKVGRPLWYRTWMMFGKQFYAKAGWLSDGYPCLSAGAGRGY
jgi:hypothetical protein